VGGNVIGESNNPRIAAENTVKRTKKKKGSQLSGKNRSDSSGEAWDSPSSFRVKPARQGM
jgi:hypothetical protein